MGILLSVCGLSQLACCATSTACNCLGCIAPSIGGRLMYAVMLFLVTVTGWIMMLPNVSNWLQSKVPFCWKKMSISVMSFIGKSSEKEPEPTICEKATGYLAVYRLMFGTFLFFIFFGFIMIKIQSKRDPRIALHRGFWLIKFIMLVSIIFGSFYIPDTGSFGSIWQNFGFIGSFLFLMIQVCFLILFADDLAASWNRMTSSDGIHFLLPLVSLINYVASVVGLALFYSYYGGSGCALHNWMISINLILIILITFTAISPKVQECMRFFGSIFSSSKII
ncbi:hypothetical protein SSS_07615 [Sarcoptes scabiei]|nr:hypothetical protein SSS_07615 [Sarcoptes scabiei]